MKVLKMILKIIDFICDWSGRIVVWVFLGLLGLTLYEVFTRRFLGKPTIWTFEILMYLFAAVCALGLGYTHLHDAHARVDIITEGFSPKVQTIIEVITFVPFLGLMVWIMFKDSYVFALTSWTIKERAPSAFNSIVYPAKTLMPLGIGLLGLAGLSRWIKSIVFLVKGEKLS